MAFELEYFNFCIVYQNFRGKDFLRRTLFCSGRGRE
jgi:hypothetical protein